MITIAFAYTVLVPGQLLDKTLVVIFPYSNTVQRLLGKTKIRGNFISKTSINKQTCSTLEYSSLGTSFNSTVVSRASGAVNAVIDVAE